MQHLDIADLREHTRHASPALSVRLDGVEFRVKDWSLGGFALHEADSHLLALKAGDCVKGEFGLTEDDNFPFRFVAAVVEVSPDAQRAAFRFTSLPHGSSSMLMFLARSKALFGRIEY